MEDKPDPLLWDIDDVVKALCGPGAAWTRDTESLEQRLREEEIDGKTLLTFGHTCSKEELQQITGVRIGRHKSAFNEEIVKLRSQSPLFKVWYRGFRDQQNLDAELNNESTDRPPVPVPVPTAEGVNGATPDGQPKQDERPANEPPLLGPVHVTPKEGQPTPTHTRPAKRKRVAPTKINVDPPSDKSRNAFLGSGTLSLTKIKSSRGDWGEGRIVDHGEGSFALSLPSRWPTGQRLVVNSVMKQLLRSNSRGEALLKRGEVRQRSSSLTPDSDDDILDLADLPDFDDETLREIEEEEAQQAAAEALNKGVSKDQVRSIVEKEMKSMSQRWRETKQWKQDQKAYQIWHKAERSNQRTRQILEAQQRASEIETRIKKIIERIVEQHWLHEAEVRSQAASLEQSVSDKMQKLWLIRLLESRVEPEKPDITPTRRPAARPTAVDPTEEILYSSDEDDFVVPDDDDVPSSRRPSHGRWAIRSRAPTVKVESQEPDSAIRAPNRDTAGPTTTPIIDLTTPPREIGPPDGNTDDAASGRLELSLTIESPEHYQSICNVKSDNFWGNHGSRSKLVIYMVAKLDFARRKAIYDLIKSQSSNDFWESSMRDYLADPFTETTQIDSSPARRAVFDICRLLLSVIKCKFMKEIRLAPLKDRDKTKIEKSGLKWWHRLSDALKDWEPHFPDESQIYRTDQYDEEFFDSADDNPDASQLADGETPKIRKTPRKEIIRDKAAVDLREREKKRNEEQETRRVKLLANLENQGNMSQDQTRLIINQSKEEDQSLIYIDDMISQRIKDHQIEGVRFMWNSLVVPPEGRQGCLLSHTMGLGKTMQVITLLVAVAEAGESIDEFLHSQIPLDLRQARTLILCPAGLVENWMDELLRWAPKQILGSLAQLDSETPEEDRLGVIQNWAAEKGVLVSGYNMFKAMVEASDVAERILLQESTIVVADEAHLLKNPASKTNIFCSRFSTKARIALTGSPLANNVEEYYFMMEWIAPNFLGPLTEFRDIYSRPIELGLGIDSTPWEKRKALKLLQVLRQTVAPKVHRATIASSGLLSELAPKREFVITVPPTAMQQRLYKLYIDAIRGDGEAQTGQVFSTINDLGLICNHPRCFRQQLIEIKKETKRQSFPRQIIGPALKETAVPDPMDKSLSLKVELLTIILDEAKTQGDKVLIFSHSLQTLDYLGYITAQVQKRRVFRLDGATPIAKRQTMVKGFNTGDQEVYLISTTAGAVGLNIQGANRVVLFDSKWNPVNEQQAVGRAYRMGQEKKVFVYHFVVAGSFEQTMHRRSVFKSQLATRVIDSKHVISWSNRDGELIRHLQDVKSEDLTPFVGKDVILDRLISHKHGSTNSVLSIVSTDTFEEEDPNFQLTDEESRDVKQMITMNMLRLSDPKEFDRLRAEQSRREAIANMPLPDYPRPQQTSVGPIPLRSHNTPSAPAAFVSAQLPSTQAESALTGPRNDQSGTAATRSVESQLRSTPSQGPETPQPQMQASSTSGVPTTGHQAMTQGSMEPIPGANTFFGFGKFRANMFAPGSQTSTSARSTSANSSFSAGNSFSFLTSQDVKTQQYQDTFTSQLGTRLAQVRNENFQTLYRPVTEQAQAISGAIHNFLTEQGAGVLGDNSQWRMLKELLANDRFVIATATGHLSAKHLALSKKEHLEQRLRILDELSEVEFTTQMKRNQKDPDPKNLSNIRRTSMHGVGSPHAKADAKAMRLAADNRKARTNRVPPSPSPASTQGRS